MSILGAVEASLKDFRPKTHRQFTVLNIARRFDDLDRLAKYLNICDQHPKKVLLEAARLAQQKVTLEGGRAPDRFFGILEQFAKEEGT
ncbi:MAG: hypothetical protein WC829_00895 [Hyphomicrobium sp.]|jgi:hypothetical protein